MKRKSLIVVVTVVAILMFIAIPAFGQTTPSPRLRYAQVVNGQQGSNTYVVTLLVSNPQNTQVEAFIDSFDDANPANPIGLGLLTNCSLSANNSFFIPPSSACRFDSSGAGSLKTGWIRVTSADTASNLGGYLNYTFYVGSPASNNPQFTVGVSPSPIYDRFSFPVVRSASTTEDIGVAMANPFQDGPVSMRARLLDGVGNLVGVTDINLATAGHLARFLSELFPGVLGGANSFVGNVLVDCNSCNANGDAAIVTLLTSRKGEFGGASPTSDSIFIQKRAGTERLEVQTEREHERLTKKD